MFRVALVPLIVCSIIFNTMGLSSADATPFDVFRGIKWGTDIMTLTDFVPITLEDLNERLGSSYPDIESTKYYVNRNEKLLIGDIPIIGIYYTFFKARLYKVDVLYSATVMGDVQELLEKKYGVGELKMQGPPSFQWDLGNIVIDHKPNENNYIITYQFEEMTEEYEREVTLWLNQIKIEEEMKMQNAMEDI